MATRIYHVTNTTTSATMLVEASNPAQACVVARRATRPDFEARIASQTELLGAKPEDVLKPAAAEAEAAAE